MDGSFRGDSRTLYTGPAFWFSFGEVQGGERCECFGKPPGGTPSVAPRQGASGASSVTFLAEIHTTERIPKKGRHRTSSSFQTVRRFFPGVLLDFSNFSNHT